MNVISSRWTWATKKIMPLLVFVGIPALLLLPKDNDLGAKGDLMMAALFLFAAACWWLFVADLADEVEDHGDRLLVRRGDIEDTVPIANIQEVTDFGRGDSPRIVLRLVTPGRFGQQVAFMPKQESSWSVNPFAKTAVGKDLAARVEQARASARRS